MSTAERLRIELAVCQRYRIPHPVWLTWPAADQRRSINIYLHS